MKKNILIALFLIFSRTFGAIAQDFIPSIPPPEANSFTKFGEYSIGHYSGIPNIEVPVYHLKDGSANMPISLKYYAAGIRVAEQATWVGLGWNLSSGGVINRNVKGLYDNDQCTGNHMDEDYCFKLGSPTFPDNYSIGYSFLVEGLQNDPSWNTQFPEGCSELLCGESLVYQERTLLGYYQPDIFSFNFLGFGGSFYYNFQENRFQVIDNKSNLKVEPIGSYFNMTGIKITDPSGTVYLFSNIQKKYSGNMSFFWQDISSESFFLSKVLYSDGGYLSFEYLNILSTTNDLYYVSERYVDNAENSQTSINNEGVVTYRADYYYPMYLSKISSSNIEISFNLSAVGTRLDVKNGRHLNSISVRDKRTNKTRNFNFQYDYFPSCNIGGNLLNSNFLGDTGTPPSWFDNSEPLLTKRLRLLSFSESGSKPYLFYYNSTPLPFKTSAAVDHWGNYNGINNLTLIPNLKSVKPSLIVSSIVPDYMLDIYGVGADRGASEFYMKAGVLEKIVYPTGGATQFDYEPNSYENFSIPPANYNPIQGVIESYDYSKEKKGSDANGAGNPTELFAPINIPGSEEFTLNVDIKGYVGGVQPGNLTNPQGQQITETQRKTEIVNALRNGRVYLVQYSMAGSYVKVFKTWSMPESAFYNGYGNINSQNLNVKETFNLPRGYQYALSVTLDYPYGSFDYVGGQVRLQARIFNTVYNIVPFQGESIGGGLRIKAVKNFKDKLDLTPSLQTEYDYNYGILLLQLKYIKQRRYYNDVISQQYETTISGSNDFSTNVGSVSQFVGYSMVSESKVSASNQEAKLGRIEHAFYNQPLINSTNFPAIESIMNGYLSQKRVFDANGALKRETYYAPKFLNYNYYAGFVTSKYALHPDNDGYPDFPVYRPLYYYIYDINRVTNYIIEKIIDGSQESVISTVFDYNSIGQVISESTYPIDYTQYVGVGAPIPFKLQETKTYYPHNPPSNYNITDFEGMVNSHFLPPLKTETFRNGQMISSRTFDYSFFSVPSLLQGIGNTLSYLPTKVTEDAMGTNAGGKRIRTFKYSNGKIVEAIGIDGVPVTFIWDYNLSYLVARIDNAYFADVQTELSACNPLCATSGGQSNCEQKWECLRESMPNARITSYSYSALDGVVTITDFNGQKVTYNYDSMSRLASILDSEGKYLQVFNYYYKE